MADRLLLDDADREEALAARRVRIGCAANDCAEFCSLVLRDEKTGGPIKPRDVHYHWHDLCARHPRLVIWSHTESGKSQQVSIGRPLWMLGRDPTRRIAIVSNTFGQAQKIIRTIASYIERPGIIHEIFPNLRKGEPWTANLLTVKRETQSKDPSVQACGVHGNITGARVDDLILDDVLDYENTRTRAMRQDLIAWFQATLVGRLTAGGTVTAIGTVFHKADLLHDLTRADGTYVGRRFPVLDENGESTWVERWPKSRIEQRRLELGSVEFARQMMCRPRDDEEARFKREWIDDCLQRGDGLSLLPRLDIVPNGAGVFTGVDLGVSQAESADKTAIFTLLLHPNGDRQPIGLESGRWSGPEIVRRIFDAHRRYHSIIYVENVAGQDFLLQFTREVGPIPVRPFTTGRNKAHPEFGVEGLAVELQNKKWIIPNHGGRCHPEIEAWIDELLYYDPKEHTGDRLMASWFAREGARRFDAARRGGGGFKVYG